MGFKVIGVAGVLLRGKAEGLLPLVGPVLDRLRSQARFRISNRLYEDTLRGAGEA
jgi:predicted nucleic acid-binding protein